MNEIRAGHVRDGSDSALSHPVLMMSTNPTETQLLEARRTMVTEECRVENAVVCMDGPNGGTNISCLALK